MGKTKRRRREARPRAKHAAVTAPSSRGVEFLTVGWGISVLGAIACEVAAIGSLAARAFVELSPEVAALSGLLTFTTVVMGIVVLLMTAVVVKVRAPAPPRSLVKGAVAIGLVPLAAIAAEAIL